MSQTAPARQQTTSSGQLITRFADKFGVDKTKVATILKHTVFKLPASRDSGPQEVSDEQLAALLIVADQYKLNPFTKEIFAFPDKQKGIVPVVSVDGWARIMNEHPAFDGLEFRYSDEVAKMDDDAKESPIWVECIIYRKDRTRPTIIREYLDECYRPAFEGNGSRPYKIQGPWQSHTRRFLRHKCLIQAARIAFGFAGIYDEDEAERIANARVVDMAAGMPGSMDANALPHDAQPNTAAYDATVAGLNLTADIASMLEQFAQVTAEANGVSVSTLKEQAGQNFTGFWAAFEAWLASQTNKTISCPDTGADVAIDECGQCNKRNGCPAHP